MNILILYPFYNQREMVQNFSLRLAERGVFVDAICHRNYQCDLQTSINWPNYIVKFFHIVNNAKQTGFTYKIARYVLRVLLVKKLFHLYDIIDFHAYYPNYNNWMRYCVKNGITFDITLWGSDLMRSDEERRNLLRYGFDNCHILKMTGNLRDVLVQYYGRVYENKIRTVYFGNSEFDSIDNLNEDSIDELKKKLYGNIGNKMIVVCGYNAMESQNHIMMIQAVSQLGDSLKKDIHIVLPMTYGGQSEYRPRVKEIMDKSFLSYTILDHFLDKSEVAVIRKTANIVVNIQDTDALSSSLKGHLYCGNVCIFGEWLNYTPFTDNGIFYIKTSKNDITNHLQDVLRHYSHYQLLCKDNHEKMKTLFSWEATISKQVLVYGE